LQWRNTICPRAAICCGVLSCHVDLRSRNDSIDHFGIGRLRDDADEWKQRNQSTDETATGSGFEMSDVHVYRTAFAPVRSITCVGSVAPGKSVRSLT
jgi:hypothetical protein